MGLAELKSALPDFAADLRRNLDSVVDGSGLTRQQLWGTVLVCAVASHSPRVLRELGPEARRTSRPRRTRPPGRPRPSWR